MNTALWIVTGVLASAFLIVGVMKLTQPREKFLPRNPWAEDFSAGQVKAIGVVEVLGALGLILPAVTGIAPILVPVAAAGLTIEMATAVTVHLRRGDGFAAAVPPLMLGLLSLFVAWGRFGPYPL